MPKFLDLTQPMSRLTPRSCDHPEVTFKTLRWYSKNGLKTHEISASLHSGTHIDTSALYFPEGETVDKISLERLIGMAYFVDCRLPELSPITGDYLESRASNLKTDEMLVLCTGWHHHFLNEEKYVLRAPGLDRSGVEWVAEKRPKAVCSDSPSPEHILMRSGQWRTLRPDLFPEAPPADLYPRSFGHKTLLPLGILLIEGLGGEIDQLIGQKAMLYALPAKYQGVEAAPVRAIAVLDD